MFCGRKTKLAWVLRSGRERCQVAEKLASWRPYLPFYGSLYGNILLQLCCGTGMMYLSGFILVFNFVNQMFHYLRSLFFSNETLFLYLAHSYQWHSWGGGLLHFTLHMRITGFQLQCRCSVGVGAAQQPLLYSRPHSPAHARLSPPSC